MPGFCLGFHVLRTVQAVFQLHRLYSWLSKSTCQGLNIPGHILTPEALSHCAGDIPTADKDFSQRHTNQKVWTPPAYLFFNRYSSLKNADDHKERMDFALMYYSHSLIFFLNFFFSYQSFTEFYLEYLSQTKGENFHNKLHSLQTGMSKL